MSRPHSPQRGRWTQRLAVAVTSAVATLAVGELVARQRIPEAHDFQRKNKDGGILVPFAPGQSADLLTEEFRVRYDINRFGYRDRLDRQEAKPAGAKRLLVFGDSQSGGWGVEFEDTYAYRLEDELGVEVINTARNGACPLWYLYQTRYAMERFDGDALLVQIFDNDVQDNMLWVQKLGVRLDQDVGPIPAKYDVRDGFAAASSRFWDSLLVFRELGRVIDGKRVSPNPYIRVGSVPDRRILTREESKERHGIDFRNPTFLRSFGFHADGVRGHWAEGFRVHEHLVRQLVQEARANGWPIVVLYIPCLQFFHQRGSLEKLIARNPLDQQLRAICEENDVPFLDAAEVFGARKNPSLCYHLWDGHMNATGHAALAEALAPFVRERVPELFD